ncbi:hypothetical protein ACS0TY_024093 [Phlomoides rotata]
MFFSILAHHTKNRCVKFAFKRSGQTVSKHFHAVLNSVLRLHAMFLVRPQAIGEDSDDPRWGKFQADDSYNDNEFVDSLDTTPEWTAKRDEMALNMFNEWRNAAIV